MRTKLRSKVTLLFMMSGMLLAVPAIALASDVNVAVVDVTAPTGSVSLSPGGSGNITINMSVTGNQAGTATFEIYRNWTLSGGTFTGSNPQEFTVNPRAGGDPPTTFTTTGTVSVAAGEPAGTYTLAVGAFDITNSNATGAKLAAGSSSNYQVTVLSDPCAPVSAPAAPVITANPNSPDGNGGWYKSIPTVSATSATSGATITYATEVNGGTKSAYSSTAPTLGQGTTVVYAKATSATCNKVSETTRTFMVDSVAPDVNPADVVNNTWRNSPLSQTFTSSDNANGSGLADPMNDATFTLTASDESADASTPTVVSRTVSDAAGNSTTRSVSARIDLTNPTINGSASPAPNGAGWNNTPVTVSFICDDALSGVASCPADVTLSSNGADQSASGTATDEAGNSASDTVGNIDIDQAKPDVNVTGVSNGATYTLGSVPTAGCDTTDQAGLSGVKTQASLSVTGGPVGSVTAKCDGAVDNADNAGDPASVTYNVVYNWSGFFSPVDNSPVFNVVKGGSSVPMKFNLGGNQGMGILAAGYPKSISIPCNSTAELDALETVATAGSSGLNFDSTTNQYNYIWKTDKAWTSGCRQVEVKLIDGTSHRANFKFSK